MGLLKRLPHSPWWAVCFGMLVVLPTLYTGLFMDDVLARVKLLGLETPWSPAAWWDLYTFARPDINAKLLAAGHHPWWADPAVKMTFFRPLSAVTHVVDYALWPHSPMLQHFHSILWYGLAVGMAVSVFRAVSPKAGKTIVLAGIIFAVAPPHVLTVGWLASRNTLIAFVLACFMFQAHLRWHQHGRNRDFALSLLWLVVGFLASEAILGGLAYVAAWQLCMNTSPWFKRWVALVPYVAVVLLWRVLYVMAGFGAAGTSIYRDPASDFVGFLQGILTNFPILSLGRWIPVPLDFWAILPTQGRQIVWGLAVLLLLGVVLLFRRLLKTQRLARFWVVGMLLALVPFSLTVPMDRLVLFAGLGMAALLSMLLVQSQEQQLHSRFHVVLLWVFVPVAGVLSLFRASTLALLLAANTSGVTQAPQDNAVPSQTFVYVNGTFHRTHYTTLMRKASGNPAVPRRSVVLTSMLSAASVTRRDRYTLEVRPVGGYMLLELDRIHRRVTRTFAVRDKVKLPDVTITVLEVTQDGRPARTSFRFRYPLEHRSYRWLFVEKVKGSRLPFSMKTKEFSLPAVGQTVEVKSAL
ncbi:MAG: hypothetical protein EP343_25335 [Deltaproteobacteria bacterium]|nr:MAG: hypothetical protein EP343_25335 [Deltaproteobacteria bacterium]